MKHRLCRSAVICACMLFMMSCLFAQEESTKPFVHPLFGNNALLQREIQIPIWGWAKPGEKVTVSLTNSKDAKLNSSATAVADENGKWMAKLAPLNAGGPYTLKVSGPKEFTATNILIGDLWVCSGQSNMEMGIGKCNDAEKEIAAGDHPDIRLFYLAKKTSFTPEEVPLGEWKICSPENLSGYGWGGFTGAGYYFGRELNKALGVPIGLIQTAWGGTIAQAWTSKEALATYDHFQSDLANVESYVKNAEAKAYDYEQSVNKWWDTNAKLPADLAKWTEAGFSTEGWKNMALPKLWEKAGLKGFDGMVIFRKEIDLPAVWSEHDTVLSLGPIDDADITFVNGVKIGHTNVWDKKRFYNIPKGTLKAGKNIIAVQVFDRGGGGGFNGNTTDMSLMVKDKNVTPAVSLAGEWAYKVVKDKKKFPPFPKNLVGSPNVVTVLYNGMISPILPAAIKGAIWYQGESNAGEPEVYQKLLPLMIKDWRSRFTSKGGNFPFGVVQLANFMGVTKEPVQNGWANLREAQFMTMRDDPNTGLAVILDIGEAKDIHPKNKQDVGKRLALWMLGTVYGKDMEYSGPLYEKMEVDGNKIRIHFTHTGKGLQAKGGEPLKWFAIAGEDQKWVKAEAVIDGNTVVVSSPDVQKPVAVRYAWANNPDGANLYNAEGLPASSFRTDNWPRQTK